VVAAENPYFTRLLPCGIFSSCYLRDSMFMGGTVIESNVVPAVTETRVFPYSLRKTEG
jgi:hypothetical protein